MPDGDLGCATKIAMGIMAIRDRQSKHVLLCLSDENASKQLRRMNWQQSNLQRSYVCNRELIKFFRKRLGWSQQQLSNESEISVRVISKAETGESIATSSIERLASTLSVQNHMVYPEDLISRPLEMCHKFMDALHSRKYRVLDDLERMVEPDATFRITGDPQFVPFAGQHEGVAAYRKALKKFFQIFEFASAFDHMKAYEYYPRGTDVVLWGTALVELVGGNGDVKAISHRQRFRFRRGKLYSLEDHYDVQQEERFVTDAAALRGDGIFDWLEDSSFGDKGKP